MRFQWLLLSFFSFFLFSLPAQAAKLLSWRFDQSQNQLVFTTDEGVQPKALLISDPTRLIIDLPGTTLGQPTVNQSLGGAIRQLRVGQFDNSTTRLVIELQPGYTIDPQGIRVRGTSPTQWVVELPDAERAEIQTRSPSSASAPSQTTTPSTPSPPAATSNSKFQVTRSGFFLRLDNATSGRIQSQRSRNRREIEFDIEGLQFPTDLLGANIAVNQYGVSQVRLSHINNNQARIVMDVTQDSPDWQLSFSRLGGLVFIPNGVLRTSSSSSSTTNAVVPAVPAATPISVTTSAPPSSSSASNSKAVKVEAIEILGNSQLTIRTNGTVNAQSRWNAREGVYEITIPNAQLADNLLGPALTADGPIARLRVQQPDDNRVVILVQPSARYQIGALNQVSGQILALELRPSQTVQASSVQIPVPLPANPAPATRPSTSLSPSQTRARVVIDPGHGGSDPGAVGIGGLREKDIILPISLRIAELLEREGIQAVLTRPNDTFVSLDGRVQIARSSNADLFVSIHANAISLSRPDVNGLETYYYSSGLGLAQTIQRTILEKLNMRDRGVRQARFYVLRNSPMPAVLVEVGFVTGREDAAKLANPDFREQMAEAIAAGIIRYVNRG